MPQLLPDRSLRSFAGDQNLAKSMADASYQVGIHAADITGHIEDITKRVSEQTELLGAVTDSIDHMTRFNATIAEAAQRLQTEANDVTDRMAEAQTVIKRALMDALALVEGAGIEGTGMIALKRALSEIVGASAQFDQIARLRDTLVRRVDEIAGSTARNREHCEDIYEEIAQLNEAEQATKTDCENASQMCLHQSDLSAELYYTILASGVETADSPFIKVVMETAKKVTQVLENAVDQGEIDLEDLFDEDYVTMPDIEPPKYITKWLPLIERVIPPICEPVSHMTPDVVLCTVTDRNGYMPVNNLRWSHPPTEDPVFNATYSRHRIRHRDRISDRINKSTKPFLVMVFRRWLGDRTQVLRDVSSPVFIKGRLWGNVRMLILIKVETIDYILKQMDVHRAVDRLRGAEDDATGDFVDDSEPIRSTRRHDFPRKFCVHHGGRLVILDNSQIQMFFAKDRLVFLQTEDGKQYPIRSTLSDLEEKLDAKQFMRCHRNYIVNIEQVDYLNNWLNRGYLLILKGRSRTEVPVSRVFVKHLKKYIEFE